MSLEKLDTVVDPMRRAARIPGVAIAIVAGDEMIFAKGYGYRDRDAQLPMDADTVYPIASTTKAMNATLAGMLVDEGKLAWDAPVQSYLPGFRLADPWASTQVTTRDLITMRTGLPRHDWLWKAHPMGRADLIQRLAHLDLSASFRERFQYNNLSVTASGYIMEAVTGQSWEELAYHRLFKPLRMTSTVFGPPSGGNVTLSYHENARRKLLPTRRFASEVTAPSGGAVHSTIKDMARWMSFNLAGGTAFGHPLIAAATLAQIHSPQIVVGADPSGPTPGARYAMGWFIDAYNGCTRLSHGGYLHDVNSEIMLFPKERIGIVTFTNFGPPTLARLLSEHAFDMLMGFRSVQTLEDALALYEKKVEDVARRALSLRRVPRTPASHNLDEYAGTYVHPGYGCLEISHHDDGLLLRRGELELPLEHWHYEVWIAVENDLFPTHKPQPFDRASCILFESSADGHISSLRLQLEPAVSPVCFVKCRSA